MKKEEINQLVIASQQGDKKKLNELLKFLYPKVQFFFEKKGISKEQTKDLTQESLAGLFKSIERYNSSHDFYSWMYSICKYKYIDFLKSKYTQNSYLEFEDQILFINCLSDKYEIKDYINALTKELSQQEKDILWDSKSEGKKYSEIAIKYNKTEAAIKMTISRVIKKILKKNESLL